MKQDDSSSQKLKELIERRKQLDEELSKLSRKVAVMFTDIVGSTRFFEEFGDVAGLVYVHKCIDMLSPIAERHGGTICKTIGDALMTYFEDPINAVRAAVDMQRTLEAYNTHQQEQERIQVRIGMNFGPGMIKDKDVFGDVVNTAARIQTLAKASAIYVSASKDDERANLENRLRAATIPFQKAAEAEVKGKTEKIIALDILWREMKGAAVEVVPLAPQMAGRVDVSKAAEAPRDKGTIVSGVSPVAAIVRPRLRYSLLVVRPDGSHGEERVLDKPVVTLGRVDGDILFPEDALVSRRHARFTVADAGLAVEDLNSANGIFWRLNKPHKLRNGDIILMGRQMFRFVSLGQPAAAKSAAAAMPKLRDGDKPVGELIRLLPGGVEENHYPLEAGENILGRTRGTISFPEDPFLSGQHCSISFKDGNFVLEDLKAQNGTFVGVREKTPLADGDIVLIGHQLLRVTASPA
ncbi:MAG: adenylate/guanylate cyclase domain-containing protein [Acidobacteria bacterium]|nr:adenylate/guanylate cyclase domain-containing protein [Acidobacteriota bacterium]